MELGENEGVSEERMELGENEGEGEGVREGWNWGRMRE